MFRKIIKFLLPALIFISLFPSMYSQGIWYTSDSTIYKGDSVILHIEEFRGDIQWQRSFDLDVWDSIPGANYDSLKMVADTSAYFRAKVTEGTCNPIFSDTIHLNVVSLSNVITSSASDITETSVTVGGNVTADGGATVTERGVYYGTSTNPETTGTKLQIGSGIGVFSTSLTDLTAGTTYYIKAYAINSNGTTYGSEETFTTNSGSSGETGSFTDTRDSHEYLWVKIGDQVWMAENLAYLPEVSPSSSELYTDPYYYVYDYQGSSVSEAKATSNYATYGVLYNWHAAMADASSSSANPSGVQGICPDGWHLPSDAEWKKLEMYLGMSQSEADNTGYRGTNEGSKLAGNEALWDDESLDSNAEFGTSGFTALPGGARLNNGTFDGLGGYAYFWSATECDSFSAWLRYLAYYYSVVYQYNFGKRDGFSVRCTKD